jgi:DNA-binding CsgD family transcriptional regulator
MTESTTRRAVERIGRLAGDMGEIGDARSLRVGLLEEIGRHVRFDAYAWVLTDPETEVGSDPLAEVPCLADLPRLIRLKYSTTTNRWTRLATPVSRLYADTDGHPERSLVWRELLSDYNVADVASVVFRDRFGCWGFLDLWRTGRGATFSADDARYLAAIAGKVTEVLRRAQARTFRTGTPNELPHGPAVLVLSPDLQVSAQTADTETYLRALIPIEGERQPVPAGAYNVSAQLVAKEAGVDDHPPRARVHLGGGAWLSLRAARMAGRDQPPGTIAVTIETASPAERIDLFSRAHGLSPREAELMSALTRGSDTRGLARELYVSENTVQDHLKSIFAKTGTRNRPALVSRALGS